MPPRPCDTPPAPGLLASAFNFVSRELESFVAAATGGDPEKVRVLAMALLRRLLGLGATGGTLGVLC